jgi:hypothetical protein
MMDLDLLDLYGRASDWTSTKVMGATSQLDEPTICDGWDVRTLLNHMLQTQRYFVGAARGDGLLPHPRSLHRRPTAGRLKPEVPVGPDATTQDRLLAYTGRNPFSSE